MPASSLGAQLGGRFDGDDLPSAFRQPGRVVAFPGREPALAATGAAIDWAGGIDGFVANAGGVICGAVEFAGGSEGQVFDIIEEKISRNTAEVLERMKHERILPREAAVEMSRERLAEATRYRRFSSGWSMQAPKPDPDLRAVS